MAPPVRLSVVIPAFNEARGIVRTLRALREWLHATLPSWEVRVVDDGSSDETARLVHEISAGDPRIVLDRRPHRGKGAAVRSGLLAARGELRFLCDADLSMPVHELSRFLEVVPALYDVAIGSREGIGATRVGEPLHRHVMGRVFNAFVRRILLPGIDDTQCGFKLFTARAVELIFPLTTLDGWAFDAEALFIARLKGLRVKEVPIEWHYRDRSQLSPLRDPWRMLIDVSRVRLNALRGVYTEGTRDGPAARPDPSSRASARRPSSTSDPQ